MSTFTAGQVLTAAQLNAIFDALSNGWTAYTPTLTNATLGNGTIIGAYMQVGKTVDYRVLFSLGSTSTVGTSPRISLPVTVKTAGDGTTGAIAYKSSTDGAFSITAWAIAGSASLRLGTSAGNVTATVPFTWATSDAIIISGTYEAA